MMKILKFGGTSLGSTEALAKAVEIVARAHSEGPLIVVVSASAGTTTALSDAARAAALGSDEHLDLVDTMRQRYHRFCLELEEPARQKVIDRAEQRFRRLADLLRGVELLRECSLRARDAILATGELLSAELFAALVDQRLTSEHDQQGNRATAVDARQLITTDESFGAAVVDMPRTTEALVDRFGSAKLGRPDSEDRSVAVVTGFIAASETGLTTTLGRGGSDYTAAIIGAALKADCIELWTDVSGVLSADPRAVPTAFPLPHLSYRELMELSHFGAKVVFPASVHPARSAGIPLIIKNTFEPEATGTTVTDSSTASPRLEPSEAAIRGISSIEEVALLRLEGDGMVGVPGIAMRLFGALARHEISVILITQSSSEHSICVAIAPDQLTAARRALEREFALEQQVGIVDPLVIEERVSIIAVVGDQMRQTPGISRRVFAALGARGINVKAIAQGSSELNISLLVAQADRKAALRAIHDGFFLSTNEQPSTTSVAVGIVGLGGVGKELVAQLTAQRARIRVETGIELEIVAIARTTTMAIAADGQAGFDFDKGAPEILAAHGRAFDFDTICQTLATSSADRAVFIDCTAADDSARWYRELLSHGVGIVTANKIPFSQSYDQYRELIDLASVRGCPLRYETTVGAGLPVVATALRSSRSGDRVSAISGVLSGTLNAVLEDLRAGTKFSQAVRSAHTAGLTEPHPYQDLSGLDVLRKLTILARVCGVRLEPDSIELQPLLPSEPWSQFELEEFWQHLPQVDKSFEQQRQKAQARGKRLRYIASFDSDRPRVGLTEVDAEHACFDIDGPNNLVAFQTRHTDQSPLVIRGPGAGRAVTAAGLLADLVDCSVEEHQARPPRGVIDEN